MPNATPRELFERQIDCIRRDDRRTQAELYAPDLIYEFPFASDRPRRIEGRDAFINVMTPMWENIRQRNARVVDCEYRFHETADPDFGVAEFDLFVEIEARRTPIRFVQLIRVRNGLIVEVHEYFNPELRSRLASEN